MEATVLGEEKTAQRRFVMPLWYMVLIGVLFICSVLMLNTKDGLCSGDISGNSGSTQNGGNMHHVGGRKTSQSSPFDYGIRFSLVNNNF